ncbi:hypothetical protein SEA_DAUDAU_56 [Streptomyces phage Daudau]|uniref:Uncharacterized protein n=1 Tax=Streptomyces phage Daudau TaxID=2041206 RepID=A0A291LHC2_9CAUD|nr:hypothetical protein KGG88_gp56 [Streptomyces phage Daudau]ATI18757.1 hypothetical protein SEA_DAUDAU_56 [Streptomyces phage Daudau]
MSNGWDWIEEGQRIAEATRQAGEVNVEAIKAESIVFNDPKPAPPVYEGEFDYFKATAKTKAPAEYTNCLTSRCPSLYYENEIGGQARNVVAQIAKLAGVELSPPLDGNIWSPANMQRVVTEVAAIVQERDQLLHLRDSADVTSQDRNTKTVAALREALIHLGEAV